MNNYLSKLLLEGSLYGKQPKEKWTIGNRYGRFQITLWKDNICYIVRIDKKYIMTNEVIGAWGDSPENAFNNYLKKRTMLPSEFMSLPKEII